MQLTRRIAPNVVSVGFLLVVAAAAACNTSQVNSTDPNNTNNNNPNNANEPNAPTVTPDQSVLKADFSSGSHIADTNNGGFYADAFTGSTSSLLLNVTDPNVYHCMQVNYNTGSASGSFAGVKLTYSGGFSAQDGTLGFLGEASSSIDLRVDIDTPLNGNTTTDAWTATVPLGTDWGQNFLSLNQASVFTWSGSGTPPYTLDQAISTTTGFRFRVVGSSESGSFSITRVRIYNDQNAATADAVIWDNASSNTAALDSGNAAWQTQSGSGGGGDGISAVYNDTTGHAGDDIAVTYTAGSGDYSFGQLQIAFDSNQNMLAGGVSFWAKSPDFTTITVTIDSQLAPQNAYNEWEAHVPVTGEWSEINLTFDANTFSFTANDPSPSKAYTLATALTTFHSLLFKTTSPTNGTYNIEQVRLYNWSDAFNPNALVVGDFEATGSALTSGGTWAATASSGGTVTATPANPNGYFGNDLRVEFTNAVGQDATTQVSLQASPAYSQAPQLVTFWARGVADNDTLNVLLDSPSAAGASYWTATVSLTRDWQEYKLYLRNNVFLAPAAGTPSYTLSQGIANSTGFILQATGASNTGFFEVDAFRVF